MYIIYAQIFNHWKHSNVFYLYHWIDDDPPCFADETPYLCVTSPLHFDWCHIQSFHYIHTLPLIFHINKYQTISRYQNTYALPLWFWFVPVSYLMKYPRSKCYSPFLTYIHIYIYIWLYVSNKSYQLYTHLYVYIYTYGCFSILFLCHRTNWYQE